MTEIIPVRYDPDSRKHTPMAPGETIPAAMAPIRAGDADYYPENHISPPLLPTKHVWLNDPQPFLYDEATGYYVMWYLYNEDDDTENGTAWREVRTQDFAHFEDHGIRIPKYTTPYGDIWSGSPFMDTDNIFGFGAGAVLFYVTMPCDKAGPGSQSVALWVSRKGLGHDPEFVDIVIPNPDGGAFRDPKVFLGDDKRTLYMLIAVQAGVACMSSLDGKTWNRVSTLPINNLGTIECPDIIKIDNQQVLIFSANGYEQAPATTQTMFLLVSFAQGVLTVTQNQPSDVKRMCVDTGPDFYAGRCGQTKTGDNIMIGWANNWNYATNLPIADFNGVLACPRLLDLHTFSDGYTGLVGTTVDTQPTTYPRKAVGTAIALSGDYSPLQFLDVPESCRIDFTIRPDSTKGWPENFGIFIGSGDVKSFSTTISMTGDGTGTGKPYIENTRNDYGGRPMFSIKEWNEYYRRYFDDVPSVLNITFVIDRGTAEVFVNGLYSQTFQVLWPIGAQYLRMSIPQGYTLSGDCTLYFNRRPGRVNGAFTRAHADSIYMFNTEPVVTTYQGDENNPHTHKILQIAYDDRRGPFFQTEYGGPFQNFWQIAPEYLDLLVYSMENEFVAPVKQIFVDRDPDKGVGVKTGYGADTIYMATKGDRDALKKAIESTNDSLNTTNNNVTQVDNKADSISQKVDVNTQSITELQSHFEDENTAREKDIQANRDSISDLDTRVDANAAGLVLLQQRTLASIQGGSPNTAGNPALLDRYPLQQADVVKMLLQSAEQKAQGQSYAGKYSLTPQRFDIDGNGVLKPAPYGLPPTDGVAVKSPNDYSVPVITDACFQLYDADTGIHYRWDQYQADSQKFRGSHWFLDGPVVSVSLDGLKWVSIRTLLYSNDGHASRVGFWLDRENKLGYGRGALIITDQTTTYSLPNLTASAGTADGYTPTPFGQDHRIYYDSTVYNAFVTLAVNGGNTGLVVLSGPNLRSMSQMYSIDDATFANNRVECPSWLEMQDTVTGKIQTVLSVAIQGNYGHAPTIGHAETMVIGAADRTTTGITFTSKLRRVEFGFHAYAQVLVDPMQQDGTGSTKNYCSSAVLNVGSYAWDYINGGKALPWYGFSGGAWIPADVSLVNGVPMLLPNRKFKAACSGQSFKESAIAQGSVATNPGWTLGVTKRCDVWRAQMDVPVFSFTGTSTVRFHFGSRYTDYVFGNGVIEINPNNSGSTVIYTNNMGGPSDSTTRDMPLTDSFVQSQNNTLVWEYDNGRIRLYNTACGTIMSEIIFPDGMQLSTVEVLGNDFFVGGFTFTVNQDLGTQY